ncbi:amidohydrolase/deacetylase family metallohydrolase [Mesorhizobium sp. B2-4-15]|uniref:amidohydrolase/deacetylase family metallohydrolase n=1 Tax=Mesorhizobium sp. B2-4-15 TaxID=2589934 RepID=UPI001154A822|nr:amidohydrolase/deacetylase family metallohydrolase [Mesorhizobium sp. B2-4-15]TPK60927.1 amidohydrolase/deacetylase family metallohydrolase [Mesorhizobium sp. B2-4-15]
MPQARSFLNLSIVDHPGLIDLHIDPEGNVASAPLAGAIPTDCRGAYVSAGWADLHVHVWHGGTDISVRPEAAGMACGVTAMADAGSAGEASFHGLREYVIERRPETIKAFINIGSIGLVACNRIPELLDHRFIDVDRTLAAIESNRDLICGVKVRASGVIVGSWGVEPLKIGRYVADVANLPLMVHIGEAPPTLEDVFALLRPGDVVTHCFNGKASGSVIATPRLFEMATELAKRGVLMDVGHGAASYDFGVAERAIAGGLRPFSISTDVHLHSVDGPVFDLATTASKLMVAGLSFSETIAAITTGPRGFLGLPQLDLKPDARADFTIFSIDETDLEVRDSAGNARILKRMIQPQWSLVGPHCLKTPLSRQRTWTH